jgi:hypothetical protein
LPAADNIGHVINGVEQMRLTSTGLGIGTSNPTTAVDVNGVINIRVGLQASNQTSPYLQLSTNGSNAHIALATQVANYSTVAAPNDMVIRNLATSLMSWTR